MGSNFDYGWSEINQAFAAGNVGMYISGSDVYTNLVSASNIDPSIYGVTPIPLAKNKTAGVLGGGTLVAVRPDANAAARAAAVKWIDFFYDASRSSRSRRRSATPRRSSRASSRWASPRCRSSTRRSTTSRTRWIKPYINVPHEPDEAVHEPASSARS